MTLSKTKKALMAVAGACLGLAATAEAQIEHRYWQAQSTTTLNENWFYNNFGATAASGRNYLTWANPANGSVVKYFDLDFYLTASNPAGCYEIFTAPVSGSSDNTDTRIWAETVVGNGNWRSVSDDNSGAGRTSYARVWLTGMTGFFFRVAAYSDSYNAIDFRLHFIHRRETTQAACQVAGKPFLVNTSGTPQFIDTN